MCILLVFYSVIMHVHIICTHTPPGLRNRDYDKVDDLYDTRLPLHNEDAFEHGIRFKAKVGQPCSCQDVVSELETLVLGTQCC